MSTDNRSQLPPEAAAPPHPRALLWGAPVVALLAVVAALVINAAQASRGDIAVMGDVPDFTLAERSGTQLTRADLLGKLHIVTFIFTRCPGVCPTMMQNLQPFYELTRDSHKLRLLSITVDPAHDSLHVLHEYAERFGVFDKGWLFARGEIDSVALLIEKGFMLDASDLPQSHPSHFILVDDRGRIRGYYPHNEPSAIALLKAHIRELARGM